MRHAGVAIAALVPLLLLTACGEKTVNADRAADTVTRIIADESGFEATDVECPEDVEAKVDQTFECNFTGPEGPYAASVRIVDIDGDDATFSVVSRPSR